MEEGVSKYSEKCDVIDRWSLISIVHSLISIVEFNFNFLTYIELILKSLCALTMSLLALQFFRLNQHLKEKLPLLCKTLGILALLGETLRVRVKKLGKHTLDSRKIYSSVSEKILQFFLPSKCSHSTSIFQIFSQ